MKALTNVARPARRQGRGRTSPETKNGARSGRRFPSIQSQRSGLNRRPLDYESSALPLSYAGGPSLQTIVVHALARTRTVTPCGTTPSRWRVYQFHHQGPATFTTSYDQLSENRNFNSKLHL